MIFATTSGIIYPAVRDRKCMMQAVQILSLARVLVKNPRWQRLRPSRRGGATADVTILGNDSLQYKNKYHLIETISYYPSTGWEGNTMP